MNVITLNEKIFFKNCNKLISNLDVKPNLVVGILTGGGYCVDKIKNNNKLKNCNFQFVEFKKEDFKEHAVVRLLLKFLPYNVLNKLRVYESKKVNDKKNKLDIKDLIEYEIDLKLSKDSDDEIKNILIIDDAIDSGKTMFIVKNNIEKRFPNCKIKIAVISWTNESSIVKPDFYIFKNILVRFPWSKDYKGKDFEQKSFSS